jgi:hypothetical protein
MWVAMMTLLVWLPMSIIAPTLLVFFTCLGQVPSLWPTLVYILNPNISIFQIQITWFPHSNSNNMVVAFKFKSHDSNISHHISSCSPEMKNHHLLMTTLTYTNFNLQNVHRRPYFCIHIYTKYQQPIQILVHPRPFLDFGHFLQRHYSSIIRNLLQYI